MGSMAIQITSPDAHFLEKYFNAILLSTSRLPFLIEVAHAYLSLAAQGREY
jgi:hypothetical protein